MDGVGFLHELNTELLDVGDKEACAIRQGTFCTVTGISRLGYSVFHIVFVLVNSVIFELTTCSLGNCCSVLLSYESGMGCRLAAPHKKTNQKKYYEALIWVLRFLWCGIATASAEDFLFACCKYIVLP